MCREGYELKSLYIEEQWQSPEDQKLAENNKFYIFLIIIFFFIKNIIFILILFSLLEGLKRLRKRAESCGCSLALYRKGRCGFNAFSGKEKYYCRQSK